MSRQDGSHRQVSDLSVDDGTATLLHLDMDAFFASVELLDHPELVGLPVIVAHDAPRSIVTTASYEARRFGVHSAMPIGQARRLCPQAVLLPPHHERYRDYSQRVMAVLHRFTPLVEQVSVDEAFLDVSGATRLFGMPGRIAERIRSEVFTETGLHCSVGVAAAKFVAKLASGMAKPDGLLIVPAGRTLEFLRPLPVGALPGVGSKTVERLRGLGLVEVRDLETVPEATLVRAIGPAQAHRLHDLARGRDRSAVVPERTEKSIGHERTFTEDVSDPDQLRAALLGLAEQTAARARSHGVLGRTVAIKVRDASFRTVTRSQTLPDATNTGRTVFETAWRLFEQSGMSEAYIRLVGVRLEQLVVGQAEASLWSDDEAWQVADQAVDAAARRFGTGAVRPARLVAPPKPHSTDSAAE